MCFYPITINRGNGHYIQVPCGQCMDCKKKRQNYMSTRFYLESLYYDKSCFLTLTYNQDSVPKVKSNFDYITGEYSDEEFTYFTLNKDDYTRWLKRFRKNNNLPNFKYLVCGEYGSNTMRPHYHFYCLGLSHKDLIPAIEDWNNRYGFVDVHDIYMTNERYAVSRYVSKYCVKPDCFANPLVENNIIEPEFHNWSKGVSLRFVQDNLDNFLPPGLEARSKIISQKVDNDNLPVSKVVYSDQDIDFIVSHMNVSVPNKKYGYIKVALDRYLKDKIYGSQTDLRSQIASYLSFLSFDKVETDVAKHSAIFESLDDSKALDYIASVSSSSSSEEECKIYEEMRKFYMFESTF